MITDLLISSPIINPDDEGMGVGGGGANIGGNAAAGIGGS